MRSDFDASQSRRRGDALHSSPPNLANTPNRCQQEAANSLGEVLKPVVTTCGEIPRHNHPNTKPVRSASEPPLGKSWWPTSGRLNATGSRETRRLTDALKATAHAGRPGASQSSTTSSRSGMRRELQYTVQGNHHRRRRTPPAPRRNPLHRGPQHNNRSKVSIQDYVNMLNAETDEQRKLYGTAHVASVKKHVAEQRRKVLSDNIDGDAFDYVLMFIPTRGAYAWRQWTSTTPSADGLRRPMCSSFRPTHLMSIVKLIEQMWRHDSRPTPSKGNRRQRGRQDTRKPSSSRRHGQNRPQPQARAAGGAKSKLHTGSEQPLDKALKIKQARRQSPQSPLLPPRRRKREADEE